MYEVLEEIFVTIVQYCCLILEIVGVIVILWHAVKAVIEVVRKKKSASLVLSHGISTGLTFLLAGEVLHTTMAESLSELSILAVIMGLRIIVILLIHWETKNELKDDE